MKKNVCLLVYGLLCCIVAWACTTPATAQNQAQQALETFFGQLAQGRYLSAAESYGGSYEVLVNYNPDLAPDDYATLWQRGCEINGLQCLPLRTVTYNELNDSGEYIFTVEFNNPDGSLFVLEACCGETPTQPPQFQFEYRVVEGGDGQFRVLDLPVYLP